LNSLLAGCVPAHIALFTSYEYVKAVFGKRHAKQEFCFDLKKPTLETTLLDQSRKFQR